MKWSSFQSSTFVLMFIEHINRHMILLDLLVHVPTHCHHCVNANIVSFHIFILSKLFPYCYFLWCFFCFWRLLQFKSFSSFENYREIIELQVEINIKWCDFFVSKLIKHIRSAYIISQLITQSFVVITLFYKSMIYQALIIITENGSCSLSFFK